MKGKYKAIISDIDGTIMPVELTALPSDKIVAAVKIADYIAPSVENDGVAGVIEKLFHFD